MKKIILSSVVSAMLATSASAFMGLNAEVGGGLWQPALSGNFKYLGNSIDFDNMGMDDKTTSGNNYLYADFSHFVPFVPNVRIEKLKYDIKGDATSSVNFAGINFSGDVKTEINMKQTDMIAYWGVPFLGTATAGVLNVNFGLDAKNLDGFISVTNAINGTKQVTFDETLPLAYLNAKLDLPMLPLAFSATIKTVSYKGSSVSDNEIKMSYTLPIPMPILSINADLGYRTQNITISDDLVDNLNADITTKGIFFGLNAQF